MIGVTYSLLAIIYGDYDIFSDGRIFSWKRRKFLSEETKGRYLDVRLMIDGKPEQWRVHRLVAMAFYGPLPEGMQTRHLNGNSKDNRITNLKYGTPSENAADKVLHGTSGKGVSRGNASLTQEQVLSIKQALLDGVHYGDLSTQYGVSKNVIYQVACGKSYVYVGPKINIKYGRYMSEEQKFTLLSMIQEGQTLREVAKAIGFDVSSVSKNFKRLTGQSIKQYRREIA